MKKGRFLVTAEIQMWLNPEVVDAIEPAEVVTATFMADLEKYLRSNGWAFRCRGGLYDTQDHPGRPLTDLTQLAPEGRQVPLADPERNLH